MTQIPLSETTSDYWRMIMEQECKYIVYFDDNLVSEEKSCKSEHKLWEMTQHYSIYSGALLMKVMLLLT